VKQSAQQQSTRPYRIYLIDRTGNIAKAHEIAAVSDEEACELAKLILHEQLDYTTIEVWDRARQVRRMP
jgi:hypothetical protein